MHTYAFAEHTHNANITQHANQAEQSYSRTRSIQVQVKVRLEPKQVEHRRNSSSIELFNTSN